jgi:hypothetical protein
MCARRQSSKERANREIRDVKVLSEIEHDAHGYHFECFWDGELAIAIEVEQARKDCPTTSSFSSPVTRFIHKDPYGALIMGNDEAQVRHVRSFLVVSKGWTEQRTRAEIHQNEVIARNLIF